MPLTKSDIIKKRPFMLDVQMGNVPGHSVLDKFGENPVITAASDPEDIWEFGGSYTYDANGTAPIVSIVSDSPSDTVDMSVLGLDIDGNEVEQTVTLTGTTRVALPTPLWRVYRSQNENAVSLVGTVKVYASTDAVPLDADVRAVVTPDHNQTLMALTTVPLGKVALLLRGEVGMSFTGTVGAGTHYATFHYHSRRVGKTFKIKKSVSCVTQGSTNYMDPRSAPDIIPALTDIKLCCHEVSETMGAWGTFDLLLIDEGEIGGDYLAAIGQPTVMP